jgi:hypothetical protein
LQNEVSEANFQLANLEDPSRREVPSVSDPAVQQARESVFDDRLSAWRGSEQKRIKRDLDDVKHASEVQKQLAWLGYFSGPIAGVWGPRSREALKAFKNNNHLSANAHWDEETEAVLFGDNANPGTFVGTWAADTASCTSFPTVIQLSGAKAGDASCSFGKIQRANAIWTVSATCSDTQERWSARVRLNLSGSKLTWTSQRGSQTYIRCEPGLTVAAHAR